jgi:hypothetical protein
MTNSSFVVPRDGPAYTSQVFDIAEQLIRAGIWSGLDRDRLRLWRKNYNSPEEQYFSACCLDRLLYRSDAQTLALMRHLWTRKLPMLQRLLDGPGGSFWIDSLREGTDKQVRVIPVVDAAHVTKSGYLIARLLEKRLRVKSRYIKAMSAATSVQDGTIIFVDDFLGGGTQFAALLTMNDLLEPSKSVRLIYAPLVAYEDGIARLKRQLPNVTIVAGEVLDSSHRVLTSASDAFADGVNTPDTASRFYYDMLARHGLKIMPAIGEAAHLGVAYAFEHAAPNNSLEIFWQSSAATWTPLFDR